MSWIFRIVTAEGIGAFVFLIYALITGMRALGTNSIWSVLIISLILGGLSYIFEIEKISFMSALVLHFISTYIAVGAVLWLLMSGISVTALTINFVMIYGLSYIVTLLRNFVAAKKLNALLKAVQNNN